MNENDDLTELRRLLPTPSDQVLSSDREQKLREYLMNEITDVPASDVPAPAVVRRPRRRLAWAALPVLAGGLALAMVLPTGGGPAAGGGPGATLGTAALGTAAPGSAAPITAAALLDRVAEVAQSKPVVEVGAGQFGYVKTLAQDSDMRINANGVPTKITPGKLHTRQTWYSADGSKSGLVLDESLPGRHETDPNQQPSLNDPTYAYLATLPTDPDALLKLLYAAGPKEQNKALDSSAFSRAGALLGDQILPPAVSAALYRAVAKIPGVVVADDAVDASGRHGVAVAEQFGDTQQRWIFDPTSYEFLGENEVVTKAGPYGKAGDVLRQTAVLQRAAVDQAGDLPK